MQRRQQGEGLFGSSSFGTSDPLATTASSSNNDKDAAMTTISLLAPRTSTNSNRLKRGGGGMPKSPMILLGITIPLVMFMIILVMGYSFLSDHTDSTSRMHPSEHPLHGITNPNSMPVVKKQHQKSITNNNKSEEINPKQQQQQQQPPSSEIKRQPREKGKVQSIGTDNVEYHIVFSTGCSAFQDWQSYVFFYQAMKVQQPGTVTRIVSGCNETEQATLQQIFTDTIAPMSPRFKIHFTPDFAKILKPGINYPYFNKPCGMKHWLEQILGFPNNPINEDAIVILLDPDQAIMRPFTRNDFSNTAWLHLKDPNHVYTQIMHGAPMGQRYGFYLQWKDKVRMSYVLNDETQTSPVDALSTKDANSGYVVGPPYIATARDMYAICDLWCKFAPRVHDEYPHLLAEMFAYCLAAAHLELPHQTAASFMVSSTGTGPGEGWSYVDKIPDEKICQPDNIPPADLPNVLHFCQRYGWGPFFFGKRKLPHDFLTCESPMLQDPPISLLTDYTAAEFPQANTKTFNPKEAKRNVFTVCFMIELLNEAAAYFKANHCSDTPPNEEHTMVLSH